MRLCPAIVDGVWPRWVQGVMHSNAPVLRYLACRAVWCVARCPSVRDRMVWRVGRVRLSCLRSLCVSVSPFRVCYWFWFARASLTVARAVCAACTERARWKYRVRVGPHMAQGVWALRRLGAQEPLRVGCPRVCIELMYQSSGYRTRFDIKQALTSIYQPPPARRFLLVPEA